MRRDRQRPAGLLVASRFFLYNAGHPGADRPVTGPHLKSSKGSSREH